MNLFNGRLVHRNPALIAAHTLIAQGLEPDPRTVADAAAYCDETVQLREGVVCQFVDTRFCESTKPSFFGNAGSGQASFNEHIHFSGFMRDLGK